MARSEAVTRNTQVAVCASTDGATCTNSEWQEGWIFFPDNDQDRQVDADEPVLGAGTGPQDMTIESDEFDSAEPGPFVVYRPNGRVMVNAPAENTGAFTFCDSRGAEFARVVIINPTGQPALSDHMADGADPECPEA
jgi:type IV fimbrial biogenesis protein FimT